jgi:hypothetical protein
MSKQKTQQLKIESGEPPKPPTRGTRDESQQLFVPESYGPAYSSSQTGGRRFYRPGTTIFPPTTPARQTPVQGLNMPARVPTNPQIYGLAGQTAGTAIPGQGTPTPTEMLGSAGGGIAGGGMAGPDYAAYRAALTEQAQQINAQIQAMYNALGEEAQANLGRIQDVYGGAQTGVGDIYGSATENVGQAFTSAQQQAADQMARLGIEAAAPQVLDPMALSQAQAVSGLETGRAGGLSALERYGSTAQDFASQMAQVAQQQGTEMNAAILASLQNRLNESLLMEEQGRQAAAQAAARASAAPAGPSFRDMLAEQQFAFDVAQAAARPVNEYNDWKRNKFFELTTPQDGQRPLFTPEEAQAYLNALDSYMSPG